MTVTNKDHIDALHIFDCNPEGAVAGTAIDKRVEQNDLARIRDFIVSSPQPAQDYGRRGCRRASDGSGLERLTGPNGDRLRT
jgi:hypothetical protein